MTDWGAILAEHGATVWRTVYRLLGHHHDAQDCYQETFVAAFRFERSQTIADWRSFLISLATRRAMDRLRQRYRSGRRSISIETVPEPPSELDDPLQLARATELMERVRQEMASLPETWQEVCAHAEKAGNLKHLFVVTDKCIKESTDGGATWRKDIALPKGFVTTSQTWVQYDATNDVLYLMKRGSDLYKMARR